MIGNLAPYQLLILLLGGVGGGICLFGMRAFINKVVNPKLYDKDGQPIYVSKAECDRQTDTYRDVIKGEFTDVKNSQAALKGQQAKIIEFQNILKGYYMKKGVKFP